jgi:hypothetical protein
MSAFVTKQWNAHSNALAVEMPFSAGSEETSMRDKFVAVRDTLVVLGLQVVFRVAMILRRWNY